MNLSGQDLEYYDKTGRKKKKQSKTSKKSDNELLSPLPSSRDLRKSGDDRKKLDGSKKK